MKRLLALIISLLLLTGCGRLAQAPEEPTTGETTTAVITTTEAPTSTEAPTTQRPQAGGILTDTGEYLYYNDYYTDDICQFYIRLPESMSIGDTIIWDMEFAGFPGAPNHDDAFPHKVGEFWGGRELGPGETLEDLARELLEPDEEGEVWRELLDSGEFTGNRGNGIFYQVAKCAYDFVSYDYVFYVMLDETHAAQMYFWNSVYTPDVDLPRFKEIAASVRL